jgi:cyclic pyranopterin phosphate synthase
MLKIKDIYKRKFEYLRLSLTDICNFKCLYCMPNKKKKEYLSIYQIYNIINFFIKLGIKKIRLTGGEPTLRKDFYNIVKIISSFKEITSLNFTTNAYNLKKNINKTLNSGFTGINISLDTLNNINFEKITNKKSYFFKIYKSIIKLLKSNLEIKINIVLSKYFIISDFILFYSLLKYKNISIRFIEQMGKNINIKIGSNLILNFLKKKKWLLKNKFNTDGPALIFKNKLYMGKIGIINPYTKNFCKNCNRLRISSNGKLFLCLFENKKYSINKFINNYNNNKKFKKFILKNIKNKKKSHKIKKINPIKSLSKIGG